MRYAVLGVADRRSPCGPYRISSWWAGASFGAEAVRRLYDSPEAALAALAGRPAWADVTHDGRMYVLDRLYRLTVVPVEENSAS